MPPQDGEQDRAETTGFVSGGKRDGDESIEGPSVEIEGGKAGELRMRVGKYLCPTRLVNTFTPMEFEEVSASLMYPPTPIAPRGLIGLKETSRRTEVPQPRTWFRRTRFEKGNRSIIQIVDLS